MEPKQTPVHTATLAVTVSTVKVTTPTEVFYDTAVFDDSPDRRHHGKTYAGWTVGKLSRRAETPEDAAKNHGDAVGALYDVTQA